MSYPSGPTSFSTSSYFPRDPLNDPKSSINLSYHNDTRNVADYMRLDFNPIVESLNFAANPGLYDTLPGVGFNTWSADAMDTDVEVKPRIDFRNQSVAQPTAFTRVNCHQEEYRSISGSGHATLYPSHNPRLTSDHSADLEQFNLATSRNPVPGCLPTFELNNYQSIDTIGYNQKLAFGGLSSASLNSSNTNTIELARTISHPNTFARVNPRCSSHLSSKSTQALAVSATSPSASSMMMTPDSSTAGFLAHKFGTSSDDGEISPTPTNSSGRPQTPNRARKMAPTLATGRRNLKGEPVDADEADRRLKRRERNRKSAQKCRERKVQRTQELQSQVECLQMEINRLTQERDGLRNEARQFVTLLQLHCPGVPVPYMSCLNETHDEMDCMRDVCGELMQGTSPTADTARENTTGNGWRMRTNGKRTSVTDQPPPPTPHTNDRFSPLPTMISLHSHVTPNRSKSLFTFNTGSNDRRVDESEAHLNCGLPTRPTVAPQIPEHENRADQSASIPMTRSTSVVSVRDPASASSSSSCSNYELSFSALDTSIHTVHNQYDDIIGSPIDKLAQKENSGLLDNSAQPRIPKDELKCDEWDQCVPANSLRDDKTAHLLTVLNSGSQSIVAFDSKSVQPGSNRPEPEGTTQNNRPLEGTCFS